MKVAIFGREVEHAGLGRLLDVVEAIGRYNTAEICFYEPFYNYIKKIQPSFNLNVETFFSDSDTLPADTGLFLTLGGDGTFLSAVPFVRQKKIPIAGINLGRLGFLTTSKIESLERLLRGDFRTERRTLLKMDCKNAPADFYPYALNEFSIQRKGPAVLELNIKVDGAPIPRYMADGVLIATATGSTAYSMSAGGPIVMPGCKVLIVVPIAPHNLNIRPLVVSDTARIDISFATRYKDATLSADNRSFSLPDASEVSFTSCPCALELVSADSDFMQTLSNKLYWGADWRNSL